MDRKLSDEQLDKITKNLLKDFAPDDKTLDEIAESPKLWWNVRSRIEAEKARREKSWLAAFRPQIPAFGVLAILICGGLTILLLNSNRNSDARIAAQKPVKNPPEEIIKKTEESANVAPLFNPETPEARVSKPVTAKVLAKSLQPKPKFIAKNQRSETTVKSPGNSSKREISPAVAVAETKTDFIALTYAANTDSGQIVRVKVPSSMMVSLGLKTNVEKESELVSAEVVIGDDGLARAIRFIR
ncbi:MAG TPA: hypothetical protein VGC97_01520 [Pyrinomonadaceae bacterium]